MFRPILAFLTLCLAAFLLAPTVASVHSKVEDLSIDRELPWQIWKWTDDPTPPPLGRPDCEYKNYHLYSEVTKWPARLKKDQPYTLGGFVGIDELNRRGVYDVEVEIFLNDTKELPGILLGTVKTAQDGTFELSGSLPIDLQAERYHIVAYAHRTVVNCWTLNAHWSDPELDIVSPAQIVFDDAEHVVVGREVIVPGRVVDSVNGPVRNATVYLTVDGKTRNVTTNNLGEFELPLTPARAGNLTVEGRYDGNEYYEGTRNKTVLKVLPEDVVLDQATDAGIALLRSEPTTLSGQIFLANASRGGNLTLNFTGVKLSPCEGCPAVSTIKVKPDEEGRFNVTVTAASDQAPGDFALALGGAGLKETYRYNGSLEFQPKLAFAAEGTSLFGKGYALNATLTDEVGRPMQAPLAFLTAQGWSTNETAADGTLALAGEMPCGRTSTHAYYNGTKGIRPAEATDDMVVCGYLAMIPPWLVGIPWWAWALLPLAGLAAWFLVRGLRTRYATTISAGPPLSLAFTQPRDDASGYASVGESVVLTAFLEEPLPDGHTLRMGSWREMEVRPLDEKLRAELPFTATTMGDVPLRAEILDARGRVVTRRTATLRVIRYAEEIEARYLRLRRESGASEAVTPREFERWLRERAPMLDGEVARRLIHVFEEADYSPRTAGRQEFAAYLAAERGVQEVAPDAMA